MQESRLPPYYSQVEKVKIPVLVLDAVQQAAFLQDKRKSIIPVKKRTFVVAFPGFYMGRVLANRAKEMEASAKWGEPFKDACWGLPEQRSQLKTVKIHLAGVMKGIEELFEETFNARWPEFSYRKRTVSSSP